MAFDAKEDLARCQASRPLLQQQLLFIMLTKASGQWSGFQFRISSVAVYGEGSIVWYFKCCQGVDLKGFGKLGIPPGPKYIKRFLLG